MNDQGDGVWSFLVEAIDWVIVYCKDNGITRAIISASLGGKGTRIVDDAVDRAFDSGIAVVVSAGNENTNACEFLLARVKSAITVGATLYTDTGDAKSYFSNYG